MERRIPVQNPDMIVVGAGHNGLTAACYMQRSGFDVLVLEASSRHGGMTSTEWGAFPNAPDHGIVSAAMDIVFIRTNPVMDDFRLEDAGVKFLIADPAYVYLDPNGASICLWKDPQRTADEMARFSRKDAQTYLELARGLDAFVDVAPHVLRMNPSRPELGDVARLVASATPRLRGLKSLSRVLLAPPNETINEMFEHQMVRDTVAPLISSAGPLADAGTGAAWIFLAYMHRLGMSRIEGGTGRIADALARRFTEEGGTIRTGAPVDEFLLDNGRVTGVRLVGGEELHSGRGVMSSADPRTTLLRLLPDGTLPEKYQKRAERIPVNRDGTGDLKVDVAFSGELGLSRWDKERGDGVNLRIPSQLIGNMEDHNRAYAYAAADTLSPEPAPFWSAILNATDPTMSPEGQDTMYIWSGWVPSSPRGQSRDEFRSAAGKAITTTAAEYFDGFEELKLDERIETSDDLADKFHATKGSPAHSDWTLGRFGPLRPAAGFGGYKAPVDGLYLTGAGTHPGVGVQGFAGRSAARRVLRDNRRRK